MTTPVRVLWLTKGLGRGGAEILLLGLARAIDQAGVHIDVAYVLPHKDALAADLRAEGLDVHCLGGGGPGSWTGRLRRLLVDGDFDVVHTHAPVVAAAARVLAPRGSILVHTEHNVWGRYRRPTRWANAVTIHRNRVVWAVSEGVARSIRPWWLDGRPPVEVMLHGIDPTLTRRGPEARAAALAKLRMPDGQFIVGTVGNFTPKKDQATLLRAFARFRGQYPDARLVVIGTGPLEGQLRALADELGIGHAVLFTGIRDDVPDLLPAFDLFVLSSLHEGLSIALVEALAAGLPIVATRVGGIPEVITHERCGLLVAPADEQALGGAMGRLASDAALRQLFAAAGPDRAADFGIQATADALTERYTVLAAPGIRSRSTVQ